MNLVVKNTKDFKKKIKQTGNTSKELAEKLGITDRYLSSITNRKTAFSETLGRLIAYELKENISDVFSYKSVVLKSTKNTRM